MFVLFCKVVFFVLQLKKKKIIIIIIIIPIRVGDEVFRSGFPGAVIHLTDVLGNDEVEALTSFLVVTGLKTLKCVRGLDYLEDVSLKHHSIHGNLTTALLCD